MIVELIRLEESLQGTIGVLKIDKKVFCFTLEPPDKLNEKNISSIPAKQYTCNFIKSPKHGKTYRVANVPDRTYINFHSGRVVKHTEGCILLGSEVDKLTGDRAILNSGNTFKRFMAIMKSRLSFHLTIKEDY